MIKEVPAVTLLYTRAWKRRQGHGWLQQRREFYVVSRATRNSSQTSLKAYPRHHLMSIFHSDMERTV